jgi:hypothetical protein
LEDLVIERQIILKVNPEDIWGGGGGVMLDSNGSGKITMMNEILCA